MVRARPGGVCLELLRLIQVLVQAGLDLRFGAMLCFGLFFCLITVTN